MHTAELKPHFLGESQENTFRSFFEQTNPVNIQQYAKGKSLTNLVGLASDVIEVINRCNPILDSQASNETVIKARQWQLNRISEVKQRIALAIENKQAYYDNDLVGIITKYILKLFCLWNDGYTTAIVKAEDFLYYWDSRNPVFNQGDGIYKSRFFFFLIPASWIQANLDTSKFYNYNPPKQRERITEGNR